MRRAFFRAGICLLPLAVTPIWIFLIAEGFLNFGGGEKDLFLVIPWLVWSALFLVIGVVAWVRGLSWTRGLAWSAAGATASLVVVGTGLLLFDLLEFFPGEFILLHHRFQLFNVNWIPLDNRQDTGPGIRSHLDLN